MKNKYITFVVIIASIVIPIALRFSYSSMYPLFWTLFVIPAALVPNWRASSIILTSLTAVEFGLELFMHGGDLPRELLKLLLGGMGVNILVLFTFSFVHLKNKKAMKALQKQTLTDPLTGAHNRRYFDSYVKKAAAMQNRGDQESFVLVIDVDHFKKLNDMYGNLYGDEVLRQVAGLICKHLRPADIFIRMGGEEFIVILPQTTLEQASSVAKSIQSLVAETRLNHKEQGVYTSISVGMTAFVYGQPMEQFIEKADEALHQAKVSGRNRVVVA